MNDPQSPPDITLDRPSVTVEAMTANTIELIIQTNHGSVRLVCGHDDTYIESRGTKVTVRP